jgi:hypothetical protein
MKSLFRNQSERVVRFECAFAGRRLAGSRASEGFKLDRKCV